jgi:hypothetical protein
LQIGAAAIRDDFRNLPHRQAIIECVRLFLCFPLIRLIVYETAGFHKLHLIRLRHVLFP